LRRGVAPGSGILRRILAPVLAPVLGRLLRCRLLRLWLGRRAFPRGGGGRRWRTIFGGRQLGFRFRWGTVARRSSGGVVFGRGLGSDGLLLRLRIGRSRRSRRGWPGPGIDEDRLAHLAVLQQRALGLRRLQARKENPIGRVGAAIDRPAVVLVL